MPKPYSEDLRLRIVKAVESGKTTREVSAIYQVSPSLVSKVHQLWKQTGGVQGKQIGGYRHALLEPYEAAIREQLARIHQLHETAPRGTRRPETTDIFGR